MKCNGSRLRGGVARRATCGASPAPTEAKSRDAGLKAAATKGNGGKAGGPTKKIGLYKSKRGGAESSTNSVV